MKNLSGDNLFLSIVSINSESDFGERGKRT